MFSHTSLFYLKNIQRLQHYTHIDKRHFIKFNVLMKEHIKNFLVSTWEHQAMMCICVCMHIHIQKYVCLYIYINVCIYPYILKEW